MFPKNPLNAYVGTRTFSSEYSIIRKLALFELLDYSNNKTFEYPITNLWLNGWEFLFFWIFHFITKKKLFGANMVDRPIFYGWVILSLEIPKLSRNWIGLPLAVLATRMSVFWLVTKPPVIVKWDNPQFRLRLSLFYAAKACRRRLRNAAARNSIEQWDENIGDDDTHEYVRKSELPRCLDRNRLYIL